MKGLLVTCVNGNNPYPHGNWPVKNRLYVITDSGTIGGDEKQIGYTIKDAMTGEEVNPPQPFPCFHSKHFGKPFDPSSN